MYLSYAAIKEYRMELVDEVLFLKENKHFTCEDTATTSKVGAIINSCSPS